MILCIEVSVYGQFSSPAECQPPTDFVVIFHLSFAGKTSATVENAW